MGKKIFVSYKYADDSVANLKAYDKGTARDYVTYLQDHNFSGDDLNKAENDDEDLSEFKNDTIKSKLRDKIWDSSITLILISPNMIDSSKSQSDQWIPWEVSYSLRTQTRNGSRSLPNGIISIVLPDINNNYDYFITNKNLKDDQGKVHNVRSFNTSNTFKIISENMFNQKNPKVEQMQGHTVYFGDCSYIITATWKEFLDNPDSFLKRATRLKEEKLDNYKLNKQP